MITIQITESVFDKLQEYLPFDDKLSCWQFNSISVLNLGVSHSHTITWGNWETTVYGTALMKCKIFMLKFTAKFAQMFTPK